MPSVRCWLEDTYDIMIICFHCGENGHQTSTCPVRDIYPQSSAGKAAFQQYIQSRKKFVKQRTSERLSANNRESSLQLDDGLKSYDKVVEWMKEVAASTACQLEEGEKDSIIQARDPIAILQAEAAVNLQSADIKTQRWYDMHKSRSNNIQKAHRYEFTRLMNKIHQSLMNRLDVSQSDVKESRWQEELTAAVELGRPGDFSSNTDLCLKVYTVEKLHARCRQLHHLLFNDDEFASKVRSLLLPVPTCDTANNEVDDQQVNIISCGGGPGYDHVSLCLVAKFLHDIQPQHMLMKRRRIKTQVFDLFDESWQPVMMILNECLDDDTNNRIDNTNSSDTMTMHHGDLRLGLDDINNTDLAQALEHVDIICIQFCLHENASFIVVEDDDHDQPHIRGIMHDLFEHSAMGTVMIITDSVNTLFPLLKRTASEYGWRYLGDDEVRKSGKSLAFQGPKNYIMLERYTG